MLLAELEIFHSRPIAPTRRLSIGRAWLPGPGDLPSAAAAPGSGSLLLGAVCARFGPGLAPDRLGEAMELVHELEQGRPVAQPRLRHRLQNDRVGLTRSCQRLYGPEGGSAVEQLVCEFDGARATSSQLVLGSAYAAGLTGPAVRGEALRAVRRGMAWRGDVGPALFAYLAVGRPSSRPRRAVDDPVGWALDVLGFEREVDLPGGDAVRRGFREALRAAHPDLGAAEAEAADRIAALSEARRILLAR